MSVGNRYTPSFPSPPGLSQAVGPSPLTTGFPIVDTFTIASLTMPGKWTLESAEKVFGWQIQQAFATSGATVLPKGDELVVAKFKGEFWANADFLIYAQIRKTLLSKPLFTAGGNLLTAAMGIDHPELKALGVTSVVVGKVGAAIDAGKGLWTAHVEFLQYRAPVLAQPKAKTVIPDIVAPLPVATTNAEKELADQRAEAAVVSAQLP